MSHSPRHYADRAMTAIRDLGMRVVHINNAPDALYIGRDMPGRASTGWGNPHRVEDCGRYEAVRRYGLGLLDQPAQLARIPGLHGHELGCWCVPQLCHGHAIVIVAGLLAVKCPHELMPLAFRHLLNTKAMRCPWPTEKQTKTPDDRQASLI